MDCQRGAYSGRGVFHFIFRVFAERTSNGAI